MHSSSAQGQIVTKGELLKQVWPDTFVEEGNLARHISLLRKILGETAGGASYVETAPKRGYRFLRPGVECGDATVLIAEEHTREHIVLDQMDTPRAPVRRFGRRTAAMVLGVLAAAGLLGAYVWTRGRTATPVRSVLVLPFANLSTDRDSESGCVAVWPDGDRPAAARIDPVWSLAFRSAAG